SASARISPCRHDTRESVMTMSDLGSRPIWYVVPAVSWWTERLVRTSRSGGADGLAGPPATGAASASPAGASPAGDGLACGGRRSDQSKRSGGMLTKCRAAAGKRESEEPFSLTVRLYILAGRHSEPWGYRTASRTCS